MNRDNVINVLFSSIEEINLQLPQQQRLKPSVDTKLYGPEGTLDSLAFISFIVTVEQKIEEESGVAISLADVNVLQQTSSRFATIETLTNYILVLLATKPNGQTTSKPYQCN